MLNTKFYEYIKNLCDKLNLNSNNICSNELNFDGISKL